MSRRIRHEFGAVIAVIKEGDDGVVVLKLAHSCHHIPVRIHGSRDGDAFHLVDGEDFEDARMCHKPSIGRVVGRYGVSIMVSSSMCSFRFLLSWMASRVRGALGDSERICRTTWFTGVDYRVVLEGSHIAVLIAHTRV